MATKRVSFQEALVEIEDIVEKIENQELDVDLLSEKVRRAAFLITQCKEKLHGAEDEVQKILDQIK